MSLDFRNTNTLWSSLIVTTLAKLGLKYAVLCPGFRSTPLTIAFAENKDIETIPILDERSASFFALGLAKRTKQATILVCTSGTAGANFYPAVIEARYSHVPLLILTADRPIELRNCYAGQTIQQVGLYGDYPNWQTELSLPEASLEQLFYLRQNIIYGVERTKLNQGGVVHFNVPFRDPLIPCEELNFTEEEKLQWRSQLLENKLLFNQEVNKSPSLNLDISNYFDGWSR